MFSSTTTKMFPSEKLKRLEETETTEKLCVPADSSRTLNEKLFWERLTANTDF